MIYDINLKFNPKQTYIMLKKMDDVEKHTWTTVVRMMLFRFRFGFVWISKDIGDINIFISIFKKTTFGLFKTRLES